MLRPLLVVALGFAAGCSSSTDMTACAAMGTLTITVSDDEKGTAICDATIVVTPPGGMPMTIMPNGTGAGCAYHFQVVPGTYQISVTKSGFGAQASGVNVTMVDCVVASPTLSFSLTRT